MTALDRALFSISLQLIALRIPARKCNAFMQALQGHVLQRPKLKPIQPDGEQAPCTTRLLLLDEGIDDLQLTKLPDELRDYVAAEGGEPVRHSVTIGYDKFSAEQVLRRLLPEGMEVPSAFEQVGHVAHMNLREEHLPYKALIGEVLLDKNPRLRSVVNKVASISNEFRVFPMEVIAGDEDLETTVRENGATFALDYREVYWNSRLEREHRRTACESPPRPAASSHLVTPPAVKRRRIVELLRPGEVVCDMMAGIGPFAVPAALKGNRVYANDLNPQSAKWLRTNVLRNKVGPRVRVSNSDARAFLRQLLAPPQGATGEPAAAAGEPAAEAAGGAEAATSAAEGAGEAPTLAFGPFSHILMNLPASALEFLDALVGAFDAETWHAPLPRVHCYCFSKETAAPEADVIRRAEEVLGCTIPGAEATVVRDVAPNKLMLCVSFVVPEAVAWRGEGGAAAASVRDGGGEGGEGGEGRLVSLLSLAGARLLPFRVSILQACALLCTLLSLAALASATGVLQGRRRRASAPPEQRTGDAKTAPACPSSPASSEKGMCAALPASICLSSSSSAVGSASNSRKSFSMEALPARHRPVASPPAAAPLRPASFSTIGELRAAAAVVRRPPSREGAGGDGSLSPARPLSREGQRVDSLGVAWPAASSQSQADLLFRMSGLGQVQEFVEGGSLLHALGPKPPSTQPPSRTPDSSSPGPDFNPVAWRRLPESGAAPSPAAASAAAEPPVAAGARHRDISPPSAATSPAAAPLSPASPDSAKSGGAAEPPMTFRTTDNLFATVDDHEASDFVERRVLGQGAFGHAVLWESRRNGLLVVAKKLLIAGTTDFRKLENEVAICASLRHPNIVQYLRTSHNDTYLVLMLEYASGGSVADQLDKHAASTTPFEQGRVCLWLAQLSSAVAYLHSVKVLHRDLSASNVFLSAAGDIKVGDFGLSKTTGVNASRSALATTMCGTPNYCSPELINGEPYGAASDVWAIGLIAYQLFTLRHPFEASSVSQLFRLICAGKVDTAALAAAPFPPELTCIADTRHLLHPNAALRMRLVELLALPALRSASPRQ